MSMPSHPRASIAQRACDSCRRRKVKCDSREPCANCCVSGLACQFTARRLKRGPRGSSTRAAGPPRNTQDTPSNILHAGDQELSVQIEVAGHGLEPQASLSLTESDCASAHSTLSLAPSATLRPTIEVWSFAFDYSPEIVEAIRDDLLIAIQFAVPSITALELVNTCINLFMQYTYPTCPIIHEATLKANAPIYFSESPSRGIFSASDFRQTVHRLRSFTLLTAVCASTASVMPESILAYGHTVATMFFQASRKLLKAYEEYDLEYPDSSSLSIRDLHYTAAQHIVGKHGMAFHLIGQATLIARTLNLHREDAVKEYDPVESQLLRQNFWHLYISDKASFCLKTRPSILQDFSFRKEFDLHQVGEPFVPLLDSNIPWYGNSFEDRLLIGFHLVTRLWSLATRIVTSTGASETTEHDISARMKQITTDYLEFNGILDALPPWLTVSSLWPSLEDSSSESYQKRSFWVQRCTLLMSNHCLRLVILQECIQNGFLELVGLIDEPLRIILKKVEVIQDFIHTMEDIPFVYHQIKGEPSVERIRLVGTVLLEMIQTVDDEAIKERMNIYMRRLLDILAKLNSKASEELGQ